MASNYQPLIIGGLIPALLYGLAGAFQKWSAQEGGSVSVYLIGFGVATVIVGVVYRAVLSDASSPTISIRDSSSGWAGLWCGCRFDLIYDNQVRRCNLPIGAALQYEFPGHRATRSSDFLRIQGSAGAKIARRVIADSGWRVGRIGRLGRTGVPRVSQPNQVGQHNNSLERTGDSAPEAREKSNNGGWS